MDFIGCKLQWVSACNGPFFLFFYSARCSLTPSYRYRVPQLLSIICNREKITCLICPPDFCQYSRKFISLQHIVCLAVLKTGPFFIKSKCRHIFTLAQSFQANRIYCSAKHEILQSPQLVTAIAFPNAFWYFR